MIDRYSTDEMRRLWSLEHKFEVWKEIEVLACEYWHSVGRIPDADWKDIKEKANFNTNRVIEIENEVHHDVIAFLTNMAEYIGPASRFVHFGLTSSDVGDTALSYIVSEAMDRILSANRKYLTLLHSQAVAYKDLIVIGRTHGVHAEPTTLGLKLLGYYTEALRNYDRLRDAAREMKTGKISGAVGTYSQLPVELEAFVLEKMDLQVEPVSTQVIPRDRHAHLLNSMALSSQGIARLAQEIRLLQKTESREVEEPFQKGQKGSSAMPHKRNPILSERMGGLARVIAGYASTGLQNILLWHERDISHSGAERVILPDATSLLEYMFQKMSFVVENIHVYPETAEKILQSTKGLLYSSKALLVITEKLGISREDAYSIVQEAAMEVWANPEGSSLREKLAHHPSLSALEPTIWEEVFDPRPFVANVSRIFERIPDPPAE